MACITGQLEPTCSWQWKDRLFPKSANPMGRMGLIGMWDDITMKQCLSRGEWEAVFGVKSLPWKQWAEPTLYKGYDWFHLEKLWCQAVWKERNLCAAHPVAGWPQLSPLTPTHAVFQTLKGQVALFSWYPRLGLRDPSLLLIFRLLSISSCLD